MENPHNLQNFSKYEKFYVELINLNYPTWSSRVLPAWLLNQVDNRPIAWKQKKMTQSNFTQSYEKNKNPETCYSEKARMNDRNLHIMMIVKYRGTKRRKKKTPNKPERKKSSSLDAPATSFYVKTGFQFQFTSLDVNQLRQSAPTSVLKAEIFLIQGSFTFWTPEQSFSLLPLAKTKPGSLFCLKEVFYLVFPVIKKLQT